MTISLVIGWGWSEMLWVALISMCLVFIVLILLVYIMKFSGYIFVRRQTTGQPDELDRAQPLIHEEEIAAIATALDLFWNDVHDKESEVLTIMSIKRAYSPWNSKIHGLTHLPDRK